MIGTDVTELPEILPSEDYGIIIPADNAVALVEAIEKGLNKDKIAQNVQSFSWDRRISEFENVYQEIVTTFHRPERQNSSLASSTVA